MHCTRHAGTIAWSAAALLGIAGPAAAELQVSGEVTLATDYMFRGASQTMSGTALQAGVGVQAETGWAGYLWASNVDFTDDGAADDGASLELDLEAGYTHVLHDGLAVSLGVAAYFFPGTEANVDYDYLEWQGSLLAADRHHFQIGYSDDVFATGSTGIWYEAGTYIELSDQLNLGIDLGFYDLEDGYDTSYNYAVLSLAGGLQGIGWQLSYFTTSDEAAQVYDESVVSDRIVLALSLEF